jgi:diaminopimelate decarboxylase
VAANHEIVSAGVGAGGPAYVYDLAQLRQAAGALLGLSLPRKRVFFATMANDHPVLLGCLRDLGIGAFVNSPAHLDLVLRLGFAPSQVVYAASNLTVVEMRRCIEAGVHVVLDSIGQVDALGRLAPRGFSVGVRVNVGSALDGRSLRIDPEYRFGVLVEELPSLLEVSRRHGLRIIGAHSYFGTGLMQPDLLLLGIDRLATAAEGLPELQYLDVGGGFGVPDTVDGPQFDLQRWSRGAAEIMMRLEHRMDRPIDIFIEPGRYLAAACGYFFVQVVDCKPRKDRVFVGTNGSVAIFPRPLLYGPHARHPCQLVAARGQELLHPQPLHICGNSTYSQDFLARDVRLPLPCPGDSIVFSHAGAYGRSMISQFLGKDRPSEMIVHQGEE